MSNKPIYILGTGLSHDGSACILKDGHIISGIEKERITRRKHDGGNDKQAVAYCLDAAGISFTDLSLVVQAANFEKEISPDYYNGDRLSHPDVPVVTISHHLAHAYSAIAASPFKTANVLVVDGAGSPAAQCDDWPDEQTRLHWVSQTGMYCEKDSFYYYDGAELKCLHKDFSEMKLFAPAAGAVRMPTNYHSIGGLYAAASNYCFGNLDDAGKLMGLAPYGRNVYGEKPLFAFENGSTIVLHEALEQLDRPAADYNIFKQNFQHYADVARWVQKETEKAVTILARHRMEMYPYDHLCYAGGVALNAVANARLLQEKIARKLYMQPAAGDNGLSIGCAFYGWHEVLKKEMPAAQTKSVFFGKSYDTKVISDVLNTHPEQERFSWYEAEDVATATASLLAQGKIVGWFREGAEFGPRALGHRSILADPRLTAVQQHINANIKFREDFRPFAPAVLKEDVAEYFVHGYDSPYMILVDEIKEHWRDVVPGIVHVDGTCRVQTVDHVWNPVFHTLLQAFKKETGISILVNTSFNRKGMPIVETPQDALGFFLDCDLDVLVMEHFIITKTKL